MELRLTERKRTRAAAWITASAGTLAVPARRQGFMFWLLDTAMEFGAIYLSESQFPAYPPRAAGAKNAK